VPAVASNINVGRVRERSSGSAGMVGLEANIVKKIMASKV
jgi:hypothetical protein